LIAEAAVAERQEAHHAEESSASYDWYRETVFDRSALQEAAMLISVAKVIQRLIVDGEPNRAQLTRRTYRRMSLREPPITLRQI